MSQVIVLTHSYPVLELESLRHLRELKADGNKITSLDGLERIDSLVKLSLQGNLIQSIDLCRYRWYEFTIFVFEYNIMLNSQNCRTRLEMLNLSHNRLNSIQGVSSLPSLIALNLGE